MVTPGTVTQCNVEFKRDTEGLVEGPVNWSQQGWTESQRSVVSFSPTEAQMDRTVDDGFMALAVPGLRARATHSH